MPSGQCPSCSNAQSCWLLHTRLLVKPRACFSMPACDSGWWSSSCWPTACFLPDTCCQLLLHAASHGHLPWVLAPASPSWAQLPAWQAGVPSWVPLSQHPWLCLAASLPLESSCCSPALPGASWAARLQSGFACWLRVCFSTNIWRRRLRLTAQTSG